MNETTVQQEQIEIGLEVALELTGVNIRYEGEHGPRDLKAIRGNSDWDQSQDGMVVREATSQDWILELPIYDRWDKFRTQAGDRISVLDESRTTVLERYEAMSPGGERPWRYMGPSWRWIRIFTKRVG